MRRMPVKARGARSLPCSTASRCGTATFASVPTSMLDVMPWFSIASPKYQLYAVCDSQRPGSTNLPAPLRTRAFAGADTCPPATHRGDSVAADHNNRVSYWRAAVAIDERAAFDDEHRLLRHLRRN